MRTRSPLRGALLATCAALGAWAGPAHAWSNPGAISEGTAPGFLAAAGDSSGEAFAVFAGGTLDAPALLSERRPAFPQAQTVKNPVLSWNGASPLPGGPPRFTTDGELIDGATAAAAGEGTGAIILRFRAGQSARLAALVREADRDFGAPVTILGSQFGAVSDPSVAIAENAETLVAFAGQDPGGDGRVLLTYRAPGASFSRARTLTRGTRAAGAQPVAATGPDGWPIIAWIGGTGAYATRLDASGRSFPVQRLASARRGSPVSAAVGKTGDAIVAWIDDEQAIRVVRRSAPRRFSASLPIHPVGGTTISGLSTAVDPDGRAFLAWRETQGASAKVIVAQAPVDGSFRLTTLGQGQRIGDPSLSPRPDGGAAVAWAAPNGFQATAASAKGVFPSASSVSSQQAPPDPVNARGLLITGPGPRLELLWRQQTDTGESLLQSVDTP